MSNMISAHLLSGVERSGHDASLISLPGHRITACIFENNFNKVYLSVPLKNNSSHSLPKQTNPSYVIKSIAVDLSPTDLSEILLLNRIGPTNIIKKKEDTKEEVINTEIQLDVSASLATEINTLKTASHTSIIELHEVYCELSTSFGAHLYLSK